MPIEDAGGMPGGWWGGATAGLGGLSDILAVIQNAGARGQQNQLFNILANPGKLASYVQSYNQPMSTGALEAIKRMLGSQWAPLTGGATGGALTQYIVDALAKLELQRSQTSGSQAIGALQGAGSMIPGASPVGAFGKALGSLATLSKLYPKSPGMTYTPWQGGDSGYGTGTEQNVADYQMPDVFAGSTGL